MAKDLSGFVFRSVKTWGPATVGSLIGFATLPWWWVATIIGLSFAATFVTFKRIKPRSDSVLMAALLSSLCLLIYFALYAVFFVTLQELPFYLFGLVVAAVVVVIVMMGCVFTGSFLWQVSQPRSE